jgi:hypothetical protein
VYVFSGANGAILQTFAATGTTRLGASVAITGDLDFDGWPDVLAGAPSFVQGIDTSPGDAYSLSYATGVVIHKMAGTFVSGRLGFSIAAIDDVDNDLARDVAIGAPNLNPGLGNPTTPGFVQVRSGATGVLLATINAYNSSGFGSSVANAGDVDGDGRADIAVGGPGTPPPGINGGRVTVFSGANLSPLVTFLGLVANEAFGTSVAGGADTNGDGVPDVVGGGQGIFTGATTGRVRLFSATGVGAPGLVRYGTACPGTGGFVPSISGFGGPPTVGNALFGFAVARGLGGATALLFASTMPAPGGFPIGGGCSAWLGGAYFQVASPIVLAGIPGTGGAGYGMIATPVPANPVLQGATFFLEWGVIDPGGPTGVVSVSDALTVIIQ